MTIEDIKTITDIVHKTIYGFFDVCGDDEETPMTDKDKLLLKINKALCNNIKALEQEPKTWSLDDAREDFMSDVYNTLDFLPTNEEANRIIDSFDRVTNNIEQEPCDDCISRELALKECHDIVVDGERFRVVQEETLLGLPPVNPQEPSGDTVSLEAFKQVIWERNIAIDQLHELGYDFGQKIEPCGDAISRQAALDAMCALCNTGETLKENPWRDNPHIDAIIDALDNLPPITPQQKIGRWIEGKCDQCGKHAPFWSMATTYYESEYCPKCGAKMQEVKE